MTAAKAAGAGGGRAGAALDRGALVSALTALFYGATSIALVFQNKWAFMVFPSTNLVLALQLLLTLAVFAARRRAAPVAAFPAWSPVAAAAAAPMAALYLGNVVFSLLSLKGLNLPMYLVLRRNTPLAVILVKRAARGSWPTPQVLASVLVVCAGSVVAGYNDLDRDANAYLCAAASCFLQASYMVAIEVRSRGHFHPAGGAAPAAATSAHGAPHGAAAAAALAAPPVALTEGEMLHYNAVLSLPFVFLICAATGELQTTQSVAAKAVAATSALEVAFAICGCAGGGLVLNYAMMLCTSTNSALTTTIVGVLKGVVGTVAGFFVLGGAKFTPAGVAGVALNTLGGCLYSYYKWQEKAAAKAAGGGGKSGGGGGGGGAGGGGGGDEHGAAAAAMEAGGGAAPAPARRRRATDERG